VTSAQNMREDMEPDSSESRLEILRFMVACERFLALVHLNGGPSRLTLDDRRRIMTYQKLIAALFSEHESIKDESRTHAA
jgi:hypothetical protein